MSRYRRQAQSTAPLARPRLFAPDVRDTSFEFGLGFIVPYMIEIYIIDEC